jgi:hypothetical protein
VIGNVTGVGSILFIDIDPVASDSANTAPPDVAEILNVVAVGISLI